MENTRRFLFALATTAFLVSGCDTNISAPEDGFDIPGVSFSKGPNPRPHSWVDGELFAGVVTPATFNPASDPFDELYAGGNGFKDGVPLISESKPGDPDYNGGRWHLNVLKEGVDLDKYENADRVEDLDLDDFESTDSYFECPLLPRRGNR
ncbi:MAG: hypothetical protein IH876_13160 [Gemmatimonadetes bacterium]|nr:hypothetical protein [Gemmatimonadota bacterium]